MSTFGYRRELSKYEDLDEDELLASLTAEELQELEKELADIDPDDNLPIGLRQRDQTAKTPTGTFSREALMKYWENETRKLLEEERIGSTSPRQKDEDGGEEEEGLTESDIEESGDEKDEAEENEKDAQKYRDDEEEQEEEESEPDEPVTEEEEEVEEEEEMEEEENEDNSPKIAESLDCTTHPQQCWSSNGQSNHRMAEPERRHSPLIGETKVQVQEPSRMSGNPTVVDEVLENILNNDPDTTEVNLNNIDNISQDTLIRFAEALRSNTHVRFFSLANTHADDQVAFAIAKMLRENSNITNLNIESNFITGKGIMALVQALTRNSKLTEMRFHNQRHICGGQVEMEIVKLLRENTTLLKLGYQFDLPGPRISMTTILTRNQDFQRQKRMQEMRQQQGVAATPTNPRTVALQKSTNTSSPYNSPRSSPWSSPKLPHIDMAKKNAPPPPPKASMPEKKSPSRMIAEVIKRQEKTSKKQQHGPTKSKSKKGKNGTAKQTQTNSILKELKNALRPINDRESSRPSTPLRCAHDQLMDAIKGSSIKNLRRVEVPQYLQ
ncbi:leiomodin-2 isoform X2 [Rhinichthys klamathensis goyatoka]|uniref:leiomodin-2 isoform X2 n=1 Tax=Rhinichthys klamathensis goyatoka TaxID=3034132 RepID=UPI0024B5D7B0|nr:leiomodin-2 isoform X2 [Rhinichthys klamathensis goyatoka]